MFFLKIFSTESDTFQGKARMTNHYVLICESTTLSLCREGISTI